MKQQLLFFLPKVCKEENVFVNPTSALNIKDTVKET